MAADKAKRQQVVDRLVGHEFWLAPGTKITVNETPSILSPFRSADGKLKFDSVFACSDRDCTFHVTFASGIVGYVRGDIYDWDRRLFDQEPPPRYIPPPRTTYPTFLDHLKPKEAERRRSLPGVALGMLKVEVLSSAWGEPDRKTEIRTSTTLKEMWFYPDGNELTFIYGRLAKIKS